MKPRAGRPPGAEFLCCRTGCAFNGRENGENPEVIFDRDVGGMRKTAGERKSELLYAVSRSSWSGFTIVRLVPLIVIHWSRRNWFSSRVTVSREVPAMLAISS